MALAEVLKITHAIRQVVINGAQSVSGCSLMPCLTLIILLDGKEAKVTTMELKLVIQQTASSVDEIKCL